MIKRHTVILAVIMFSNVCGILFIHARREVPDLGDRLVAAYHLVKGDGVMYGMKVTGYDGAVVNFISYPDPENSDTYVRHSAFVNVKLHLSSRQNAETFNPRFDPNLQGEPK